MKKVLCLLVVFFISGCIKPSAEIVQTAIAETQVVNQNATKTAEQPILLSTDTAISQIKTSYVQTQNAIPTNTQTPQYTETPTETPIPPRLITATAVQATKQYVAEFKTIAWKELKGYPDNHKDEQIKITGRVFQIIEGEALLLWYPGTYDAFYASFDTSFTGIYEDETITIYGTVVGEYCYDTQSGGSNCVPQILVEWYIK